MAHDPDMRHCFDLEAFRSDLLKHPERVRAAYESFKDPPKDLHFNQSSAAEWLWVWRTPPEKVLEVIFSLGFMCPTNPYVRWVVINGFKFYATGDRLVRAADMLSKTMTEAAVVVRAVWFLLAAPIQFRRRCEAKEFADIESVVSADGNGWLDTDAIETCHTHGTDMPLTNTREAMHLARQFVSLILHQKHRLLYAARTLKEGFIASGDIESMNVANHVHNTTCESLSWWFPSLEFLRVTLAFLRDTRPPAVETEPAGGGGASAGGSAHAVTCPSYYGRPKVPVMTCIGSGFGFGESVLSLAAFATGLDLAIIMTDGMVGLDGIAQRSSSMCLPVVCQDGLSAVKEHGPRSTVLFIAFPSVNGGGWHADAVRHWRKRNHGKWLILVEQIVVKKRTEEDREGVECCIPNTGCRELVEEIERHWEKARDNVDIPGLELCDEDTSTFASYWRVKGG